MTQKRYNEIPKRQKCINKEEPYIGGAVDIIDDELQKPQSQVNQERIEDITAETQRAQQAEGVLDGKVSTERQRAEGVEGGLNTRLQTVEQLAEISIGGGDAQIATGADFTNPDATKRAKVPTVGAIVDGLNDGVYDVSKRNPSGGPNSDGKFTLEYILNNADTLIPISWRHGGMLISFVDSSDNKYVQYRLMHPLDNPSTVTADFVNTANWQGVDETPIAGSHNLVESGGVHNELSIRPKNTEVRTEINDTFDQLNIDPVSENDKLVISDKNLKIIGYFDKNGLHTTDIEASSVSVETISLLKLFAENITDIDNALYISDRSNNIIAKFTAEKGLEVISLDTDDITGGRISFSDLIQDAAYIVDKNDKIIAKFTANGLYVNDLILGGQSINKYFLFGKELFTVGDSLSAAGKYQKEIVKITGCFFDQSKNILSGHQISTGGTITYGSSKDCALARIVNIKEMGYNPDIILLQNVNDRNGAFDLNGNLISGTVNDKPVIINQVIEGGTLAEWNNDAATLLGNIDSSKRMLGTSLGLSFTASGKNMKITHVATSEGNVTVKITTNATGALYYGIHVLTTDTISDLVNKILEYNYTLVTDTLGDDDISVDFCLNNQSLTLNVEFIDTDNTGMTVLITDTDSAKSSTYRIFRGENLTTDWINPEKWITGVTFYSAWKGLIEYAKLNFPKATIALLLFPCHVITPSTYMNADGTFDQEAYNNTLARTNACYNAQKQIAEIYSIPVIDVHSKCGITIGNYSEYYYDNNIHPKDSGYKYFGEIIAKELMSII